MQFWMAHLNIHIRLLISKWSRSHAYQSQSCGLKNRQIASVWTREKRDCASGRQKKAETLFFLFNIWGQNIYGLAFWFLIYLHIQEKYTQKAYTSCPLTLVMLTLWRYHNNFGQFKFMIRELMMFSVFWRLATNHNLKSPKIENEWSKTSKNIVI